MRSSALLVFVMKIACDVGQPLQNYHRGLAQGPQDLPIAVDVFHGSFKRVSRAAFGIQGIPTLFETFI